MKRSPSVLFDMEEYPPFLGFPREAVEFFKRLKRNNNRAWFEKHRNEYEECAKQPMQSLVASLRPHFERFAPEYDLNPKRSIFRIYRDTRFIKKRFGKLEGARLQRMPKGYDEGHPMEEYLKLKQFFVGGSMPESRAFSPKFLDDVAAICEAATPLVLFLNDATRGVKVGR